MSKEFKVLTREQVIQYIKNGAAKCPFCNSTNIEADDLECEDTAAWQKVYCWACHEEWQELFTMNGISQRDENDIEHTIEVTDKELKQKSSAPCLCLGVK